MKSQGLLHILFSDEGHLCLLQGEDFIIIFTLVSFGMGLAWLLLTIVPLFFSPFNWVVCSEEFSVAWMLCYHTRSCESREDTAYLLEVVVVWARVKVRVGMGAFTGHWMVQRAIMVYHYVTHTNCCLNCSLQHQPSNKQAVHSYIGDQSPVWLVEHSWWAGLWGMMDKEEEAVPVWGLRSSVRDWPWSTSCCAARWPTTMVSKMFAVHIVNITYTFNWCITNNSTLSLGCPIMGL